MVSIEYHTRCIKMAITHLFWMFRVYLSSTCYSIIFIRKYESIECHIRCIKMISAHLFFVFSVSNYSTSSSSIWIYSRIECHTRCIKLICVCFFVYWLVNICHLNTAWVSFQIITICGPMMRPPKFIVCPEPLWKAMVCQSDVLTVQGLIQTCALTVNLTDTQL